MHTEEALEAALFTVNSLLDDLQDKDPRAYHSNHNVISANKLIDKLETENPNLQTHLW